ncbi:pickpocket protein 28-like [Topomyia yanbarensis]|uniref:pickpocket protein 28-like n=1 Tax=Topomyia yanbarensis TaxID=2498891 RepID=UPI00273C0236|nr:pickpocket protein 28-like [Topomyia yanbarensis]
MKEEHWYVAILRQRLISSMHDILSNYQIEMRTMGNFRKLNLLLREYCSENFVFAARYLAQRRLSRCDRLWWALWIVVSLAACVFAMLTMIRKWNDNPIVTVYAPRFLPISTIPFPAITICPLTKSRVDVFNLTRTLELVKNNSALDEDSEMKLRVLSHVCPFSRFWMKYIKRENEDVFKSLKIMTIPFRETTSLCMWRFKFVPCSSMLGETLVDDGICYTFNALAPNETYRTQNISPDFLSLASAAAPSDWTRENGYRRNAGLNAYPHRPFSAGLISGLIVALSVRKIDQEFACQGPYTGYKFSVHAPDEIALTEDQFFRLNTLNAVILNLRPEVIITSKHSKSLSPEKRNCYFANEYYLRYFKLYNVDNCIAECVSNYTYKHCGCVRFTLPRSADMKICDASQIACYRSAYAKLYDEYIREAVNNKLPGHCLCYPSCNKITYNVEISQFPFYFEEFNAASRFSPEAYSKVDAAVMYVSFKERRYIPLWRGELLGMTDVIAKFGGLFALLMGASVLSLGEIFYYCCIRPLRRERQPRPVIEKRQVQLVLPWMPPNRQVYVSQRWM